MKSGISWILLLLVPFKAHKKTRFPDVSEAGEQGPVYHYPFWLADEEVNQEPFSLGVCLDSFPTEEEENSYLVPSQYLLGRPGFCFGKRN